MSIPQENGFERKILLPFHQFMPDYLPVLWYLAEDSAHYGESEQALEFFQKIADLQPLPPEALVKIAKSAYYLDNYLLTVKYLRQLRQHRELQFDEVTKLGYAYQQLNAYDKALNEHLLAEKLYPDNTWNLTHIGYCLQELERYTQALEYYLKAYDITPNDDTTCLNLGWLYLIQENISESRRFSEESLKHSSRDESAMMNLAHTYLCEGELKKAQKYYLKSVEMCRTPKQFIDLMEGDYDTLLAIYPHIKQDYARLIDRGRKHFYQVNANK